MGRACKACKREGLPACSVIPLLFRRVGSRAGGGFLPKESFGVEVWKLCASKIGRVASRMWYGCSITVGFWMQLVLGVPNHVSEQLERPTSNAANLGRASRRTEANSPKIVEGEGEQMNNNSWPPGRAAALARLLPNHGAGSGPELASANDQT